MRFPLVLVVACCGPADFGGLADLVDFDDLAEDTPRGFFARYLQESASSTTSSASGESPAEDSSGGAPGDSSDASSAEDSSEEDSSGGAVGDSSEDSVDEASSESSSGASSGSEGASGASSSASHAHHDYANVLYYMIFALTNGMLSYWLLDIFHVGLPYTVLVFVEGLVLGLLHFLGDIFSPGEGIDSTLNGRFIGNFGASIDSWANIDSHLLLYGFLPILLFGDSMSLNWEVLKGTFVQCLFLAGPGVMAGTALTAAIVKYTLPYDWDWETSATFGSILAATDPVAVVGILKELGCSKVLTMQIAGESLLNDGVAIVFFTVFKDMMLHGSPEIGSVTWTFLWMPSGAVAWGIFLGVLACFATLCCSDRFQHSSEILQLAIPLITAYWSFFYGEHEFQVSGVLACVFAAFTMTRMIWPLVLDVHGMHAFWHMLEFLANTMIFFLSGTLTAKFFGEEIRGTDIGCLFYLYAMLTVIRFTVMFISYPIMVNIGMGTNWKDTTVVAWGGLRGAVGLALALQVNAEVVNTSHADKGHLFVFHIGGVACLTLIINATTCKKVVSYLGMTRRSWSKDKLLEHISSSQRHQTILSYKALAMTSRFKQHHRRLVRSWVTALRDIDDDLVPSTSDRGHASAGHFARLDSFARIASEQGCGVDTGLVLGPIEDLQDEIREAMEILSEKDGAEVASSLATQRELYYSIVRSSYQDMTKSGMLPTHSRAVLRLQNSVDFGECRSHDPLCDLAKLTGLISVGNRCGSLARLTQCLFNFKEGYNVNTDMVPIRRKEVVFDLYDIVTFIDAHQAAERQISKLKISQDKDPLLFLSMQHVVLESRRECHMARQFLEVNNIGPEFIALVRTLQLALHLMYGEEHRMFELLNIGAVSEQDMHDLKHEVHHDSLNLFRNSLHMQNELADPNVEDELVVPHALEQSHLKVLKAPPREKGGKRMSGYDAKDDVLSSDTSPLVRDSPPVQNEHSCRERERHRGRERDQDRSRDRPRKDTSAKRGGKAYDKDTGKRGAKAGVRPIGKKTVDSGETE